jgi:hypothetical protein
LAPTGCRMRAASIMIAQPIALSVAPVRTRPRIEVPAEHHDFISLVRAANLATVTYDVLPSG